MSATLVLADDHDTSYVITRRIHLRDRVAARWRSWTLDHALAEGASPDSNAALALRAEALIGQPARRDLANQICRIILDAHRASSLACPAIISRRLVLDVDLDLSRLALRLVAEDPVDVRGVASVSVLIRDGSGPLYAAGPAGASELRAAIEQASEALELDYR